ncbi:MAG: hypothetical protein AB8B71_09915 [Paracoccaceae bacterium]
MTRRLFLETLAVTGLLWTALVVWATGSLSLDGFTGTWAVAVAVAMPYAALRVAYVLIAGRDVT